MLQNIILFSIVLGVIVLKAKCDGCFEDEMIYDAEDEIDYEIGE